jgi:hypothetical protein
MVGGSLRVHRASSITKTGRHDIAEILLKLALNTNNQINSYHRYNVFTFYYASEEQNILEPKNER